MSGDPGPCEGPHRGPRAGLAAAGGLLCGWLLGACIFSGGGPEYEASSGPYDRLPRAELGQVREARALLEDGLPEQARDILVRLAARRAENIPLAIMLQEVRLRLAGPEGAERIAEEAVERAEAVPTPVTLLLAARLETDAELARERIATVLEIDGRCAWAHYALAHLEAKGGDWVAAGRRLERARERDPGRRQRSWPGTASTPRPSGRSRPGSR